MLDVVVHARQHGARQQTIGVAAQAGAGFPVSPISPACDARGLQPAEGAPWIL